MTPGDHDPNRIVVSWDDLDEGPAAAPPVAPPPMQGPASLPPMTAAGPPPTKAMSPTTPPGSLPPLPAQPTPLAVGKGAAAPMSLATLGTNSVVSGLAAGLIGGAVGAIVAEVLTGDTAIDASETQIRIDAGVWVAIFGAVLGFTILAWEGITSSSFEKAGRDGLRGLLIGGIAGFVGGYTAQWLYSSMLENIDPTSGDPENAVLVARVVGWAIFGAIAGLGMGIPGGQKKAVNGLIGGAIGGGVGGFLFQQMASTSGTSSEATMRVLGLIATGAGIGLGVGIVDRLRRDAWLRFTAGPMSGKEFILFKEITTVGTDYRCDIVLAKDETVLPRHASLLRDPRGTTTVRAEAGATVTLNGVPVAQQRLRSGDTLGVGRSGLQFQERAVGA